MHPVASWIHRRAERTPNRRALVFEGRSWTYAQLDDRAARLAQALHRKGLGRGDRIAVLGDNHPLHLLGLLAANRLGAIAVMVHPGFSDEAIAGILRDADCQVLLHTEPMTALAQRIGPGVVASADQVEQWIAAHAPQWKLVRVSPTAPSLLAYTSGTTGARKGVVLTHANLFYNVVNALSAIDYGAGDVMLTAAPLYRMGGLGMLLPVLFLGGTCVLQGAFDPGESLALIERYRVTTLFQNPAQLDRIRREPGFAFADLSTLRVCLTGGTWVSDDLVRAWWDRGVPLQPGYGLSEASPLVTVLSAEDVRTQPGSVGRPVPFTEVRVVDGLGSPLPPGAVGELQIRGPNITPGYWRRPDLTDRAIVPGGWFRTGDAARIDRAGFVWLAGRLTHALHVEGARVYPAEIEALVLGLPDVAEAAITADPDGKSLVAWVVVELGVQADEELSRQILELGIRTPRIGAVHFVHTLPRNPNGKLLRGELEHRSATAA